MVPGTETLAVDPLALVGSGVEPLICHIPQIAVQLSWDLKSLEARLMPWAYVLFLKSFLNDISGRPQYPAGKLQYLSVILMM